MQIKFEGDLEYQRDAVESVVDLFSGQEKSGEPLLSIMNNKVVSNKLDISEDRIFRNYEKIKARNNIESTTVRSTPLEFSIEMETGTGKTYVFLRTILELSRNYGLQKFIIVVPSVAIREGVFKTLKITKSHFNHLYPDVPYNFYEYNSKKLRIVRQFSGNNSVQIMVLTLASFNKETNRMNNYIDQLNGDKPIELISMTNPIVIIDEPQKMETEKAYQSIAMLNPLLKLRYSATHRVIHNLLYQLTPVDAYEKNLVKKIEVLSVVEDKDINETVIKCLDITPGKSSLKAKLEVFKKQKTGQKLSKITVKKNDDLYLKTGLDEYKGYKVSEIDASKNIVKFQNQTIIHKGTGIGTNRKEIMRRQIYYTIKEHFEKQRKMRELDVKVLSLIFIDKVDNYLAPDAFIKKAFLEEFKKIKVDYPEYANFNGEETHSGYFSKRKRDSSIRQDKETFNLIMRDKERLLSFSEPVMFIFSHSALREGWDNPNIFNICTLNESNSEVRKRQEVGRGLRLPVNILGNRVKEGIDAGVLTVIANRSYSEYVSGLQKEYPSHIGMTVKERLCNNARERRKIQLIEEKVHDLEFEKLWRKIAKKTEYHVKIDTQRLIDSCISTLREIQESDIEQPQISANKISLSSLGTDIEYQLIGDEGSYLNKQYNVPEIIERICRETKLTRKTIFSILSGAENLELIYKNPKQYVYLVSKAIKDTLNDFLLDGVKYTETGEKWGMELFDYNVESYKGSTQNVNKSIYDAIIFDSKGEREFAERLDADDKVKLFLKLPRKFVVFTPIGEYNPDWAIIFESRDLDGSIRSKLYLVTETKFVDDSNNLRKREEKKIKYASKHFKAIEMDFEIITNNTDLSKITKKI